MRWGYPTSKFRSTSKVSAELERVACNSLQKFSTYPFLCFSTKNLADLKDGDGMFALLDTAYSLRLVTAFTKILDRRIQQRIVELVEQVADRNSAVGAAELTALDRHVGARVRGRRLELQLSESRAAEALRCTIDHLRACEEGRAHISAVLLFEMSRILKVEVSYFFDGVSVNGELQHEHP